MTPDELSAIEARANAATPGEWQSWRSRRIRTWCFIETARTDIPALCAALREAWAERDAAKDQFPGLLHDWFMGRIDDRQLRGRVPKALVIGE